MELNAFWSALLRRWYMTFAGLILAVAITSLMVARIGPTYKAEGSVLLFPPSTTIKSGTTVETQGNPYLMLGGLSQARDILIRTLQSKSAKDAFADKEPDATYEATPDFTTSGPIIVVDVKSHSDSAAVHGLQTVMGTVPDTLSAMQSGLHLTPSAYITSRPLTADKTPEVVRSGQIRSGIVVGAVVIMLTLFLLALLDGLLEARKARGRHGERDLAMKNRVTRPADDTAQPTTRGRRRARERNESTTEDLTTVGR